MISHEDVLEQNYTEYEAGGYSPSYIAPASLDPDTLLYSEEDDIKRLEYSRRRTLQTGKAKVGRGFDPHRGNQSQGPRKQGFSIGF